MRKTPICISPVPESSLGISKKRQDSFVWAVLFILALSGNVQAQTDSSCDQQKTSEYTIARSWKDLGSVHNRIYKDMVWDLENILKSWSWKICDIHSGTRKMESGEFRLSYRVQYAKATTENNHEYVELRTHVWHEKDKARKWVQERNKQELPDFKKKWDSVYLFPEYFPIQGGDADLYQEGILAVAHGKK